MERYMPIDLESGGKDRAMLTPMPEAPSKIHKLYFVRQKPFLGEGAIWGGQKGLRSAEQVLKIIQKLN